MRPTSELSTRPGDGALALQARRILDEAWMPEGYAVPNLAVYPFQWLWDSCFHALAWHALGVTGRAVTELASALGTQAPDGFVPHMNYARDPDAHADLWGRSGASSITQPPMFGHAVAVLSRDRVDLPQALVDQAVAGVRFLLDVRPRHPSGLVRLCHPWESGADNSPRWDDTLPGRWTFDRWRDHKSALVGLFEPSAHGSPLVNPAFDVGSVGFSALVVFNARELVSVTGDASLARAADALASVIADRWDPEVGTWIDAGATETGSGRVRTIDAALGALVVDDDRQLDVLFAQLVDPAAFGGRFGPAGVHRSEPTYEPGSYWRGPVWPQMSYLMWLAARRSGRDRVAEELAGNLHRGAIASGFAEYWDADSGTGGGACPQTWSTLAVCV